MIAPLIRRRFYAKDQDTRRFKTTPKMFGPDTRLEAKDEFFLTLMKLRLDLLGKEISSFGISNTFCTQIFHSWAKGRYGRTFLIIFFNARYRNIATTPKRYRHFKNLIRIIDCSEIFIETPKNVELKSATWSKYKHHSSSWFVLLQTQQ